MIDFTEKFKAYSNSDLLKITENPSAYQPLAVETAQSILSTRQVSEQDLETARNELTALRQEKDAQKQKRREIENKVKNIGISIVSSINPIQTKPSTSDRIIKTVCVIFGIYFLVQLYNKIGMIYFMFSDTLTVWDLSIVLSFLFFFILPISLILFFKRKKIGWILFSSFLTFSTIDILAPVVLILKNQLSPPLFNNIFPPYSPMAYFLPLFFFVGTFWVICKASIRKIYTIDKKTIFKTIGIVTMLTVLAFYEVLR